MARATDTASKSQDFEFSQDAVDELSRIFGDSTTRILPQLQTVLDGHLRFLTTYYPAKSRRKQGPHRDIRNIVLSLQTLVARIDQVRPHTKERLEERASLYDLAVPNSAWDDLMNIRENAHQALRRLAPTTIRVRPRRPRGRPEKPERRSLADYVALILRLNGIRVTSARGGKFDKVLSTVLTEAEGKAPVDLFRLIGPASAALKGLTDEECRQVAESLALPNRP